MLSYPSHHLSHIMQVILQCVHDEGSILSLLAGCPDVVDLIIYYAVSHQKIKIKVTHLPEQYTDVLVPTLQDISLTKVYAGGCVCSSLDSSYNLNEWEIKFPKPTGINVVMMPFIMSYNFQSSCLPEYLKKYWKGLIWHCFDASEFGKVCYLTIHETLISSNSFVQKRAGIISTGFPGVCFFKHSEGVVGTNAQKRGTNTAKLSGGVYIASNCDNSYNLWDCQIVCDNKQCDLVGEYEYIDHLRSYLPQSKCMQKNVIYWVTERTPYESLPLKDGMYHQFFQLVTSKVSVWYKDYSSQNPLGVVPNPATTKIVRGLIFGEDNIVCSDGELNAIVDSDREINAHEKQKNRCSLS